MENMHIDAGHRGFTQTQQEFSFLLPLRVVMQCREELGRLISVVDHRGHRGAISEAKQLALCMCPSE